jgi:predicted MPP superfamily phosphohydrolase
VSAGRRRLLAGLGFLALAGLLQGLVVEPRFVLTREKVRVPLVAEPLRLVHLSDLHVVGDRHLMRRLLRRIAAEEPELILISGDLIAGRRLEGGSLRHVEAASRLVGQLRGVAPVLAVQGHSDHLGAVVGLLDEAGVEWLSNEGRRIGPRGSVLLLGLNQQVGFDHLVPTPDERFTPLTVAGEPAFGKARPEPGRFNFYSSYDPAPAHLADEGGPFGWSGYQALCDVWVDGAATGAGIAVHSRHALGEQRMIRLARAGRQGPFTLTIDGSGPVTGRAATGVVPEPGRWYRLRLRTEVAADRVRAFARAWPADEQEPVAWQAEVEDGSRVRSSAGTVALWAWGDGTVAYRGLQVHDLEGAVLLDEPFSAGRPAGWVDGARASRLELALARSPAGAVASRLPRVVLTHDPAPARQAAAMEIDLVLAGHTHGGQVRIPGFGALITRTALGRRFDRGLFGLPGAAQAGAGLVYVNAGVGTSFVPVRLFSPPTYAVVELGSTGVRRPAASTPRFE